MSEPLTRRDDQCYEVWLTTHVVEGAYPGQDNAEEAAKSHQLPKPEGRDWTADWWQERPSPNLAWRLGWLRERQSRSARKAKLEHRQVRQDQQSAAVREPSSGQRQIRHDLTIRPELIRPSDVERFLQRVQVGTDEECWEWQGERRRLGHGRFNFQNRAVPAHVFVWVLQFGPWPAPAVKPPWPWEQPFLGCHQCDNPPCCNPWHIYPGTHQDNSDDMDRRDRTEYWRQERVAAGFAARLEEVLYDDVFIPFERKDELLRLWSTRVRMVEGGYIAPVINEERAKAYNHWLKQRQQRGKSSV